MYDDTAHAPASADDRPTVQHPHAVLSIELCDGFVTALRILVALRGRGCTIERVAFSGDALHLRVELAIPPGRERSLLQRVSNLVGVRSVAVQRPTPAPCAAGSQRTG